MNQKILEYHSEKVLPEEIAEKIKETECRINEHRYEPDKINCDMSHLKGYLIRWFADHLESE